MFLYLEKIKKEQEIPKFSSGSLYIKIMLL